MEQLKNFSVDLLMRSITNTIEADEYYSSVFKTLEEEINSLKLVPETVQKTKKAKQTTDASSRKAAAVDGGNKENVDRTNALVDESNIMDSTATGRPTRARKLRVTNLRESILSGEAKIVIKKEPVDKPAAKPKTPPAVSEATVVIPETPAPEKRKSGHEDGDGNADAAESNKKLDDSVELIAKKPDLVEVSDDDAEIMPPPAMPVPKTRKPRTKKQPTGPPPVSGTIKIKQEPVEEFIPKRSTRSKVKKTAVPEPSANQTETFEHMVPKVRNSSMANASTVSTETSVTTAQQQVSSQPVTEPEKTRSKARTKSKKPVIDKVTKKVIPEPVIDTAASAENQKTAVEECPTPTEQPVAAVPVPEAIDKETMNNKGSKKNTLKKQSTESVYEDAKSDSKLFSTQASLEDAQKNPQEELVDAVAASASESTQMEVDAGVANVNNETFIATSVPPVSASADCTFDVPPAATGSKMPQDSIMTDDMSVAGDEQPIVKKEPIESPPRKAVPPKSATKAPPSAKKAHEIFNPFVQSPVKAKVDAYERHAKESKIPVTPKYVHVPRLPVASQPLPSRVRDNDTTPVKGVGVHGLLATASDTTGNKLAHMKKVLGKGALTGLSSGDSARGSSSTVSSVSSAKSIPRTASAEDMKRMATTLQMQAEEKRKKREEKQRLAQQNREKMEREKKEQLEKLAKEREEKAKKLLVEKAELAKQEKKKQAMARLAMENSQQMKIKELQMKQMKAVKADGKGYGWDLLRSEDSTDDEEKVASKLPPPPSWSRDPQRTKYAIQQSEIPSKIIDTFFGLKPMSPDLREIFPDIDPKLLKRNSSMIWKTPPRLSRIERVKEEE